ncbi:PSMB2 [Cordylochernes scorpioides]|uniref:PSMB2 n=1 Tax=Cordylochernes scorpioides TaxID=51811 RepID=A0ABY6K3A2_9ARAC|nr:PSMB2 [Cordylochernes scorpioides]
MMPDYPSYPRNSIFHLTFLGAALQNRGEVLIRFSSHFDHQSFETTALVLTKLTNNIPSFTVKKINYSHMKGLILADPSYFKSREIDVILGSDIVFNLIQEGRRNGDENEPSAIHSKLGWLVYGPTSIAHEVQVSNPRVSKIIREDFYVDDLLTGCPTVEDAKGLVQQLIAVLGSGGFVLRKWVSNETSIIEDLPLLLRGQALTPGHFLIGNAIRHDAESDHSTLNLRSRWSLIQPQRDYFWNRWSFEYLHQLQERRKWRTSHPDVNIGDLVMLKEQNKPLQWKLARIVQIFPGEDDHVRVVLLRIPKGLLKRPITKICPLPYKECIVPLSYLITPDHIYSCPAIFAALYMADTNPEEDIHTNKAPLLAVGRYCDQDARTYLICPIDKTPTTISVGRHCDQGERTDLICSLDKTPPPSQLAVGRYCDQGARTDLICYLDKTPPPSQLAGIVIRGARTDLICSFDKTPPPSQLAGIVIRVHGPI